MKEILEEMGKLNILLNSESAEIIAKYWFWKEIFLGAVFPIVVILFIFTGAFYIIDSANKAKDEGKT